jgi:hypothetical protein
LSSNCFYYALIPQPPISSSYFYSQIIVSEEISFNENELYIPKRVKITRQSSYQAQFEYSYQCISTLMTIYDSVYIYMSILLFVSLLGPFIKCWYRKNMKE